jgi:hypothetical protein
MEKQTQDKNSKQNSKPSSQNGRKGLGRPDEGKTAGQSGNDQVQNRSSDPDSVQQ